MSGAQSILVTSIQGYQDKYTKRILEYGRAYMMKKRFLLGEGLDYKKVFHAKMLYKTLCTENCDLEQYIWDKINGKLKDKCSREKPLKHLIEQYKKECNKPSCTDSEVITECAGKIEW